MFTIGLLTLLCGFLISLPFHPALSLIHYKTSFGTSGSLLDYQWLIYLYVLTSCTQNVCSQFIRALGFVRLYAVDGIFRTLMTILLNILYLKVFEWNIFGYVFSIICADALSTICLFLIAGLWKYIKPLQINFHLWRGMLCLFPAPCTRCDFCLYCRLFRADLSGQHAEHRGQRHLLGRLPRPHADRAGSVHICRRLAALHGQ